MAWEGLADRYGTPMYVYDLAAVRRAWDLLTCALPDGAEVLYSLKANPHPQVVTQLAALGAGAEVSSPHELAVALEAGVPADAVVYTGPGKGRPELDEILDVGARLISVDSGPQLRLVQEAAARSRTSVDVVLRINPPTSTRTAGLAMTGVPSPFGIDAEIVLSDPGTFETDGRVRIVGLHLYLGSNVASTDALIKQFDASLAIAKAIIERTGMDAQLLDLGGGFAAPYARPGDLVDLSALRTPIEAALTSHFPRRRGGRPRIAFESGRYLTATAGTLVTTVVDVKESKGRRFAVVDTGIHHLGGMGGLGRIPRVEPVLLSVVGASPAERPGGFGPVDVVGPLCTPLDWSLRGWDAQVAIGDRIAIPNVGAYGLTASLLAFLSRHCPIEVVVDDESLVEATRLHSIRVGVEPGDPTPLAAGRSANARKRAGAASREEG